jgi:hypothetical protein
MCWPDASRRVVRRPVDGDILGGEQSVELSGLRPVERTKPEREVPILRSAGRLCEERKRWLTNDVKVERVGFGLLRRVYELDLSNLVPQGRSYETRERSSVGQPRHEHRQARIHWR